MIKVWASPQLRSTASASYRSRGAATLSAQRPRYYAEKRGHTKSSCSLQRRGLTQRTTPPSPVSESRKMASSEPPKITLHWLETSRATRILWLLEELKLPYELKTYKRQRMLAPSELKAIHPLGKSPIITIETPGSAKPLVLVESAAIAEYLCDYYGKSLVPARYREGQEGKIGGETESWLRYRHLMHYTEGSLQPDILIAIIMSVIKKSAPFFITPITNGIVGKVTSGLLKPEFENHYKFLESQLETSPEAGEFLCGKDLSAADILLVFPLEAGQSLSGHSKADYPRVSEYLDRLHERDEYKRAVKKIEEIEGVFKTKL